MNENLDETNSDKIKFEMSYNGHTLGDKIEKTEVIYNEKSKIKIFIVFAILLILLGILNCTFNDIDLPLYYAGLAFFLGGVGIALFEIKPGIFFLFSHGGTGLAIIVSQILSTFELQIYLSDDPTTLLLYLRIITITVILAVVLSILYNLNDRLKDNLKAYTLILILYLVAITMVVFLPKLLPYLL